MFEHAAQTQRDAVPGVGEVLAQKYRVESVVGRGGMGVVLSARHIQLGQAVAIKLLTLPDDEDRRDEAIDRFLHEAQAAARVQTDHVVRIYDVGQLENGLPFMVMELLAGADLGSLLEERGPLPEAEAVDYVLQACAGIAEAHQMGIVHRDLKPANLFVTRRSDGLPLLKVLDFGISKQLSDPNSGELLPTFTNTRTLMGSPNYMSPEQIRDARRVDGRADVWAMGIILQELLTNRPVFQADSFPGVCAAIIADPPMPVRTLRPDVSEKLESIIERCLQKDPQKRYQSINELSAELSPLGARASMAGTPPQGLTYGAQPRVTAIPVPDARAAEIVTVSSVVPVASRPRTGPDATLESARLGAVANTHSPLSSPDSRIDLITQESGVEPVAAPPTARRWLLPLGLATLVLGGALWWQLTPRPSAEPASSGQPPPSAPLAPDSRFTLNIDSEPPGATVSEGSVRLGSAPFSLSLDLPEGSSPRVFVVEKEGFQPYVLRQGPAHGEVRVRAALSPLAVPASAPEVSASAAPPPTKPPRATHVKPAAPPSAKPPSDIRLER